MMTKGATAAYKDGDDTTDVEINDELANDVFVESHRTSSQVLCLERRGEG